MTLEAFQHITIDQVDYVVSEHPQAKGMPYGQEGRKAVVYQLTGPNETRQALKVFKRRFRIPRMTAIAEKLEPYAGFPGLQVCRRTVLTASSHAELLSEQPELTYGVLMPWIDGPTWQEWVLLKKPCMAQQSLDLARSLTQVLVKMEEQGLAHCDLSGPNIILSSGGQAILVDLEEMYGPGFIKSDALPSGSPGYGHRTASNGLWGSTADRFAGGVLLAEILGGCDERVRQEAWGESYFSTEELQQSSPRAELLENTLRKHWGKRVAELYLSAWSSDTLDDCPTLAEWLVALPKQVPNQTPPAPKGKDPNYVHSTDSIGEFIALGKKFEAQANPDGARMTYQHALTLAQPGSRQAQEIQAAIKHLEPVAEVSQTPESNLGEQSELDEGLDSTQSHQEDQTETCEVTVAQTEDNPIPSDPGRYSFVKPRFRDAKVAMERKDWKSAKNHLEFVLSLKPDFQLKGETAQELLQRVEIELANENQTVPTENNENMDSQAGEPDDPLAPLTANRLFRSAKALMRHQHWEAARDMLFELISISPEYTRDGKTAAELLEEVNSNIQPTTPVERDENKTQTWVIWLWFIAIVLIMSFIYLSISWR